jgi:hypothetical protein
MIRLPDIDKKLKRFIFLARAWFWAAVHSPDFQACKLFFEHPPVSVEVYFSMTSYEFLLIQITFSRPKLSLYIPWNVRTSFIKSREELGEIISESSIDDIPF